MKTINLNFGWKFTPTFDEKMTAVDFNERQLEEVNIPHTVKEVPFNNFDEESYQLVSCYRKHIMLEPALKGKTFILEFEGVMCYAEVYVNGDLAFTHKGGFTAFRADISKFLIFGNDNVIAVKVDSRELEDIPPFGGVVDYLCYGGIYREVYLYVKEEIYIESLHLTPVNSLTSPQIKVQFALNAESEITALVTINDMSGAKVGEAEVKTEGKQGVATFAIAGAKLWDIDSPYLYSVSVKIGNEVVTERCGIREAKFKKNGFFLNGKRVKIRGLNRHQSYPYVGYAMPQSAQEADAIYLKNELGLNLVRTSHYPNSKHFLNKCDELGLMVFTEIPGWQFVSKKPEWREICLQHIEEMIDEDFNHPSIILWGVRINESGDDKDLYTKTNKLARALDNSRQTGGVRCIPQSNLLEDVYTYNDFTSNNKKSAILPKAIVCGSAPYLITEYAGHMFPTKTFDHEKRRQQHALVHANVLDKVAGKKGISGSIGWCMSDYNTHKDFGSGDKVCYHGVSDMFRIDKLAASVYKIQQTAIPVLEISSNMEIGDNDGGQVGTIYMFTNCDKVKLYKNNELINEFDMTQERKKSEFKNLAFPPVEMLDIIGDQLERDEQYHFKKRDSKKLKTILLAVKKYGTLPGILRHLPSIARLLMKYKLSIDSVSSLFGKYCSSWGQKQVSYRFEGYMGDKMVVSNEKGAIYKKELSVKADSLALEENATYDVTRIVIKAVNQFGNVCPYDNSVVTVETNGIVDVIGGNTFALIGGQRGLWVKTNGKSGLGKVTIMSEGKKQEIEIAVVKKEI